MKVYRTVRLLTKTALNIIAHNGRCADIDCNLCPLHIDMCNVATMKLLDPNKRKPLLIEYLIKEYGEQKTKELLTESLI